MVHLVESNGKKAAFLREAVRVTGVPAEVHHDAGRGIWGKLCRNASTWSRRAPWRR